MEPTKAPWAHPPIQGVVASLAPPSAGPSPAPAVTLAASGGLPSSQTTSLRWLKSCAKEPQLVDRLRRANKPSQEYRTTC